MKKVNLLLFILATLNFNSFSQGQTNMRTNLVSRLVGEWVNIDSQTRGITKVVIHNNDEFSISAYGKCHPTDCEWGKVKVHEIAASIDVNDNIIPFDYLLAIWEMDGAIKNAMTIIMKITVETGPKPKLHIEAITIFNDDRDSSDYHSYYIMEKRL